MDRKCTCQVTSLTRSLLLKPLHIPLGSRCSSSNLRQDPHKMGKGLHEHGASIPPAARSDEMCPQAAACPFGRASQTRSCVTAPSRCPPRSPGTTRRTPTTRTQEADRGRRRPWKRTKQGPRWRSKNELPMSPAVLILRPAATWNGTAGGL